MPPFKAYIGNIPYGAGEEELKQFFENLSVSCHNTVT
jgi:hypothetical protein